MSGQSNRNLVPLRQAAEHDGEHSRPTFEAASSRIHATLPPKRRLVAVACDNCRHKRTKYPDETMPPSDLSPKLTSITILQCGGQRPICRQCFIKREICVYETEEGETVGSSLKRKLRELEDENTSYKELYLLLKTRPETETEEILRRIRDANDPLDVLKYLQEAELLLTGSSSAASTSASASASASTLSASGVSTQYDSYEED